MPSTHPFLKNVDNHPEVFYLYHNVIEDHLPIHKHNKHQLCYIEGGVAFLNTADKSYFIPARHFIWIPAGIEHYVIPRTSVKMVYNIFWPTHIFPEAHKVREREGIYPVTSLLKEMINYIKPWQGEFTIENRKEYEFLMAIKNIVLDVTNTPLAIALPTTNNEKLRAVLIYIHNHIEQPLLLDQIAQNFGYSARTLSRLFQNNIETSFLQYVKLTRIIKSMELLLQSDLSISEIAYQCGYSSLSSFSFSFHQTTNQSPADFRKQNQI